MGVEEAHKRPRAERRSQAHYKGKQAKVKEYDDSETLIGLVVCDIVNGVQRSDIIKKLMDGMYDGQKMPYSKRSAEGYYSTAMYQIKEDREEKLDELKDKLYSQYYTLFNDAIMANNTFVAKTVLDSIAKVFIDDKKKDVSINVDKANDKVSIKFGFGGEEEE